MPAPMAALLPNATLGARGGGSGIPSDSSYALRLQQMNDKLNLIGNRGGGGGPGMIGPPESPGGPTFLGKPPTSLGALSDQLAGLSRRIPLPPSPGSLPGAVSGDRLLGLAPGADQLPGVGGFTNLMDSILGFGRSNPSYEDVMANTDFNAYSGGPNPFQNMLRGIFGKGGGGSLYG